MYILYVHLPGRQASIDSVQQTSVRVVHSSRSATRGVALVEMLVASGCMWVCPVREGVSGVSTMWHMCTVSATLVRLFIVSTWHRLLPTHLLSQQECIRRVAEQGIRGKVCHIHIKCGASRVGEVMEVCVYVCVRVCVRVCIESSVSRVGVKRDVMTDPPPDCIIL